MTSVRVGDLPSQSGHGLQIHCVECRCSWSADRGDYFTLADDFVMTCGLCTGDLVLGHYRSVFVPREVQA